MSGPITIVEHAKDSDELTQAYVQLYSETSDILAAMPYENVNGGMYKYTREDTLPGIAFRGVNESYVGDIGVENPQAESLFIAGGDMDVDKFLVETQGESRRAREEAKKAKQMARSVTDAILYGDNETNPKEFDGLQRRLTGTQVISNNTGNGGGALSLSKLDEAIGNTVEPTHLIVNRKFRDVWMKRAMRDPNISGNIYMTKDDFGRNVMMYNELPFLVGYEVGPDAKVLPFTEPASADAAAVTSSIYVVSLKEGHIMGIQSAPMRVDDLGEIDDKPVVRTRCEWYCGMVIENQYAATRLRDITDAAIVA